MDITAPSCNGVMCGAAWCSKCTRGVCDECSAKCDDCDAVQCFDCVDACDKCATLLCQECINVTTESCTCCKMPLDTLNLCTGCVLSVWMQGIKCQTCKDGCREGECKRKKVVDTQVTCPICWEDIDDQSTFQSCGLHRVCNACAITMRPWMGCPLCRDGHFTP